LWLISRQYPGLRLDGLRETKKKKKPIWNNFVNVLAAMKTEHHPNKIKNRKGLTSQELSLMQEVIHLLITATFLVLPKQFLDKIKFSVIFHTASYFVFIFP
jgi:hypothetical protein